MIDDEDKRVSIARLPEPEPTWLDALTDPHMLVSPLSQILVRARWFAFGGVACSLAVHACSRWP